ncbi:uncharacterized protein LOC134820537 [Bolinopsis microptera]|uniref:uncharacterized protein LOC134820537 n=1 Tax=Bolinopsis microptera TaxID=2820187 RepID=UPI00307B0261
MGKGMIYSLFPCCMDTRSASHRYVVKGASQQYVNRQKIKLAKQNTQRNFEIKSVNRSYSKAEGKDGSAVKLNKPLTQMLAINKFKSLKQRRITRLAAEAAANAANSVEADAETKKANRNSIKSIPEDEDLNKVNT